MILGPTKIAGDLRIAKGSRIYASGEVRVPPLAILEESTVAPNNTVLFSAEDSTPGTIRTSGTAIADGTITFSKKPTIRTDEFTVSASSLTTTAAISTQPAEGTVVTTCRKLTSTAPSWSADDKVYVSKSVCYIYSATQLRSSYDETSGSLAVVYPNKFISPTANNLKGVTEYRLITDHTFSPN